MPKGIAKSGKRNCSRRVVHIPIACEVCGAVREYSPGVVRRRGTIRFCSLVCRNIGQVREDSHADVVCDHCGEAFRKRRDHLRENNYCSRACVALARRAPDAKWRDPARVAAYMRSYTARHRERLSRAKRDYMRAHPGMKLAINRARRAGVRSGAFSEEQWAAMKRQYSYRCLRCGQYEPTIKLTADHIIPLARGGAHAADNIQPLCTLCNSIKNARTIDYRAVEITEVEV